MEILTTHTLAAAALDLLNPGATTGIDITLFDAVGFTLTNTGGVNAISALEVLWSDDPTGTRWSVADVDIAAAFAAIAAGGSFSIERADTVKRRMRIRATSAAGTTCALDFYARVSSRKV